MTPDQVLEQRMPLFYDGMTDKLVQDVAVFQPLMLLAGLRGDGGGRVLEKIVETLLPGNQVETVSNFRDLVDGVLEGSTALVFDGNDRGVIVETKGFDYRGVEKPSVEAVVRGPQEAFTENFRTNTALVRRILQAPELVTEIFQVGRLNRAFVGVMYLDGVANPRLVEEVRRRISSIKTDFVNDSGLLEQFIEDAPLGLAPQALATERPDRVAANLVEGRVAILARLLRSFPGQSIVDVGETVAGPWFNSLFVLGYLAFFLTVAGLQLRQFSEQILIGFNPETPISVVVFSYLTGVGVAAYLGIEVIARTARSPF